jgi:hypothetical protein
LDDGKLLLIALHSNSRNPGWQKEAGKFQGEKSRQALEFQACRFG